MTAWLGARASPVTAAHLLRRLFGRFEAAFAVRLWDGSIVGVGRGAPAFTLVIPSPAVFGRLLARPTPLVFAEAYVEGAVDLEGDLEQVMPVANELEGLRLTARERLGIVLTLLRGAR